MRNIFNNLLACLCIADLMFLVCNLLLAPLAFGNFNHIIMSILPFAECGSHIMFAISIFLIISITIERYQVSFNIFILMFFQNSITEGGVSCPSVQLKKCENRLAVSTGMLCAAICRPCSLPQYSKDFDNLDNSSIQQWLSGTIYGLSGKFLVREAAENILRGGVPRF